MIARKSFFYSFTFFFIVYLYSSMMHKLLIKDAFRQILWRVISAIGWFVVVKLMTPYLGPLRYGDYSTILKYFAIRSAFADFGLYVIALRTLGEIRDKIRDKLVGAKKNTNIQHAEHVAIQIPDGNEWDDAINTLVTKEWWEVDIKIDDHEITNTPEMQSYYGKFVWSRFITVTIVYTVALLIAYLIPAYTSNPYLVWWLPLGMLFSASFMIAGILQLPLQLYRWMKHVSIALTLARISQIIVIVGLLFTYKNIDFASGDSRSITAFLLMIWSVLLSAIVQWIYVRKTSNTFVKLSLKPDRWFTRKILKDNRKYGLAYCLSSLHTLGVLILLGIFYPTANGFKYVGVWAVASALMEILLIVPSSLWNSIIPKISSYTVEKTRKVFGSLLLFVMRIGWIFFINFSVFRESIISFVSWKGYLSMFTGWWWSDTILPWLSLVLLFTFAKQVYNFLFVALDLNNKLLKVNGIGIIIGAIIGFIAIPRYWIAGAIFTQMAMEIVYTFGSILIAHKNHAQLIFSWKMMGFISLLIIGCTIGGRYLFGSEVLEVWKLLLYAIIFNSIILAISYKPVRKIMKWFDM